MDTKKAVLQALAAKQAIADNVLIVLAREHETEEETLGNLYTSDTKYPTIELPNRGNARNISRIPEGTYPYSLIHRKNGTRAVWIRDVPNRSEILIHYGNHPSHSKGCILVQKMNQLLLELPKKGLISII